MKCARERLEDFINSKGGEYNFPDGETFITPQNDLCFPVSLYRIGDDYFFEFDPECGDIERCWLGDIGEEVLDKLAEELGL